MHKIKKIFTNIVVYLLLFIFCIVASYFISNRYAKAQDCTSIDSWDDILAISDEASVNDWDNPAYVFLKTAEGFSARTSNSICFLTRVFIKNIDNTETGQCNVGESSGYWYVQAYGSSGAAASCYARCLSI